MSFQERLKEALTSKGMTSNALSNRLGISSTAAWNWMHGNTRPKPDMLLRVAQELGVTAEWLRGGEASAQPAKDAQTESPLTVDEVLATARSELSRILKLPESRVQLNLNITG